MPDRRELLKIIGAVGTTCAFPFPAAQLYGQHTHPGSPPKPASPGPYRPRFFTQAEFRTLAALTDLIIPPTGTPGAVAANVPEYIDGVVSANTEHQNSLREGIRWLDEQSISRFSAAFADVKEGQQIELLTPLSEAVDRFQAGRLQVELSKAMGTAVSPAARLEVRELFFRR